MNGMFCDCASLTAIDLSNLDMSNVKYMNGMFLYCESLKTVDLPNFDILKVECMKGVFEYCESLASECKSRLKSQGFEVSIRKGE